MPCSGGVPIQDPFNSDQPTLRQIDKSDSLYSDAQSEVPVLYSSHMLSCLSFPILLKKNRSYVTPKAQHSLSCSINKNTRSQSSYPYSNGKLSWSPMISLPNLLYEGFAEINQNYFKPAILSSLEEVYDRRRNKNKDRHQSRCLALLCLYNVHLAIFSPLYYTLYKYSVLYYTSTHKLCTFKEFNISAFKTAISVFHTCKNCLLDMCSIRGADKCFNWHMN